MRLFKSRSPQQKIVRWKALFYQQHLCCIFFPKGCHEFDVSHDLYMLTPENLTKTPSKGFSLSRGMFRSTNTSQIITFTELPDRLEFGEPTYYTWWMRRRCGHYHACIRRQDRRWINRQWAIWSWALTIEPILSRHTNKPSCDGIQVSLGQ